jgi:hypothetical protein
VSPYELEEWEGNMELELATQHAKLEAELESCAPLDPNAPPPPNNTDATFTAKGKPVRPPKHTAIKIVTKAQAKKDEEGGKPSRIRRGAMSLSTFKERKIDKFPEDDSGDEIPSALLRFSLD